jgi:hypothetical protein
MLMNLQDIKISNSEPIKEILLEVVLPIYYRSQQYNWPLPITQGR